MINKIYKIIDAEKIDYIEDRLPEKDLKGLQVDNIVIINSAIDMTTAEKTCVLAEELGHFFTNAVDALDSDKIINIKSENRGKQWAYEKLLPLSVIIRAYEEGIKNRYELSEFAHITEEFVEEAISYYRSKYGMCVEYEDYKICFEPCLMVYKNI